MKQSGTHRWVFWGLLAALLVIAGGWFLGSRPSTLPLEQITEPVLLPEPATAVSEADKTGFFPDDEYTAEPGFADPEIDPSPTSLATVTQPPDRVFTAEELADRTEFEARLEQAIGGDDLRAMELSHFVNECSSQFTSAASVKRSIDYASRRFAEAKPLSRRFAAWPVQSLENIEAFEQFQWQTFRRCESSRDLFGEDFWQRLRREADAGNPAARYLYATLQRAPVASGLQFDQWDEALEHNERVYQYTVANMSDREPLGVLAMAQTLPSNSSSPYSRFNTRAVLTTAAIKCGLQSDYLDRQLDDWIRHFESMQQHYPDALGQLNEASDEVRRMFCR